MSGSVTMKPLNIDISEQVLEALKDVSEKCTEEIRDRSPREYGKYAAGWTWDMIDDHTSAVHNTATPKRLALWLEFGHRARDGSSVPPQEHIRPVYNRYKEQYLNKLKSIKIESTK